MEIHSQTKGHTDGHTDGFIDHVKGMNSHQESLRHQSNGYANRLTDGSTNGTHTVPHVTHDAMHVPVAICGMGMRLPGGVHNDRTLYEFLINKKDARSITPGDRYNVEAYYSTHDKHGTIVTKHGYFMNDVDFSKVDLSMFTLTPSEAEQLDPNHRLALEVVREAFESSGETEWRGKNIGTYVGMFSEDWLELRQKDTHEYSSYRLSGNLDFALPNRISYEYDLKGPR